MENTELYATPSFMSSTVMKLAEALSKAQGQFDHAKKDVDNTFFKSRYADLASVIDAAKIPLATHGLSVLQVTDIDASGKMILTTILMHSSGEWVSSRYPIAPVKNDPQSMGSALTYARRYALSALIGIAADDDDGNDASGRGHANESQQPKGIGTPGVKRSVDKKVNEWVNEQLGAINQCMTIEDLRVIYPEIIRQAREKGCTDDQLGFFQDQKDARKEFLTAKEA